MSVFPTAGHLAKWAGVCPGNNEPGGKKRSGRTTQGSPWLVDVLIQAAWAASHTKNTSCPPSSGASVVASARTVPRWPSRTRSSSPCGTCVTDERDYVDLGNDYFDKRNNPNTRLAGCSDDSKPSATTSQSAPPHSSHRRLPSRDFVPTSVQRAHISRPPNQFRLSNSRSIRKSATWPAARSARHAHHVTLIT